MKWKRLVAAAAVCAMSVCSARAQRRAGAPPAEKAALEFVAAMLYDAEPARALGFFDRGAARKGAGRGSAVEAARRELPGVGKRLAVSEIVFFRAGDIASLRARFAGENYSGFNWERVAGEIGDGTGCLVVGKGPKEDALIAFVFKDVGGRQRIVYQEDN
jgi:hypothetical protein